MRIHFITNDNLPLNWELLVRSLKPKDEAKVEISSPFREFSVWEAGGKYRMAKSVKRRILLS